MPINKDNNKNIRKPSINSGSQVRRDSSNTENFSRKPPHKPPKRWFQIKHRKEWF